MPTATEELARILRDGPSSTDADKARTLWPLLEDLFLAVVDHGPYESARRDCQKKVFGLIRPDKNQDQHATFRALGFLRGFGGAEPGGWLRKRRSGHEELACALDKPTDGSAWRWALWHWTNRGGTPFPIPSIDQLRSNTRLGLAADDAAELLSLSALYLLLDDVDRYVEVDSVWLDLLPTMVHGWVLPNGANEQKIPPWETVVRLREDWMERWPLVADLRRVTSLGAVLKGPEDGSWAAPERSELREVLTRMERSWLRRAVGWASSGAPSSTDLRVPWIARRLATLCRVRKPADVRGVVRGAVEREKTFSAPQWEETSLSDLGRALRLEVTPDSPSESLDRAVGGALDDLRSQLAHLDADDAFASWLLYPMLLSDAADAGIAGLEESLRREFRKRHRIRTFSYRTTLEWRGALHGEPNDDKLNGRAMARMRARRDFEGTPSLLERILDELREATGVQVAELSARVVSARTALGKAI